MEKCKEKINSSLQKDDILLFFDLETTGLPVTKGYNVYHDPKELRYYTRCRIIEIGFMVCTIDNRVITQDTMLVHHPSLEFDPHTISIHGITPEMTKQHGIKIIDALEKLVNTVNIYGVTALVCHNLLFDFNVLSSELYRENMLLAVKRFQSMKHVCTMENAKVIMRLYKSPKLQELYNMLVNKPMVQTHRALDDVLMCKECFFALKKYNHK